MKKKVVALVLILAILVTGLYWGKKEIAVNHTAIDRYSRFWDYADQYDVWFMGSSHTYFSIQPMQLWKEYGITSFDLATPSSFIPLTYWTMECALQKAKPNVIVVDTYHAQRMNKTSLMKKKIHTTLDGIPLSTTKVKALFDLFDDKKQSLRYLFPVSRESKKNENFSKKEKRQVYNLSKGAKCTLKIQDITEIPENYDASPAGEDCTGVQYLKKIIEECKAQDIQIIVAVFPCRRFESTQSGFNEAREIAEKYNVPFMDFREKDGVFDWSYDFSGDGHVNLSGAQKITAYMGKYLDEEYSLTDHRNEDSECSKMWEQETREYEKYLIGRIKNTDKLNKYLIGLRNEDYNSYIYIRNNDEITDRTNKLIKNASGTVFLDEKEMKDETGLPDLGDVTIAVKIKGTGETADIASFVNEKRIKN